MDDEYSEWLGGIFYGADAIDSDVALRDLPDSYFWKKILDQFDSQGLYNFFQMKRYEGVLFAGKRGNGKHTTADALAVSCWKKRGVPPENAFYAVLTSQAFPQDLSEDEIRGRVGALFDQMEVFFENGYEYAILMLDQMETYPHVRILLDAVSDNMSEKAEVFSAPDQYYVICITEEDNPEGNALLDRLFCCSCPNPGTRQRRQFLEQELHYRVPDWTGSYADGEKDIYLSVDGVSLERLADETAGLSYRDLSDLIFLLKMELVIQGNVSDYEYPEVTIRLDRERVLDILEVLRQGRTSSAAGPAVIQVQAAAAAQFGGTAGAIGQGGGKDGAGETDRDPSTMKDSEIFEMLCKEWGEEDSQ